MESKSALLKKSSVIFVPHPQSFKGPPSDIQGRRYLYSGIHIIKISHEHTARYSDTNYFDIPNLHYFLSFLPTFTLINILDISALSGNSWTQSQRSRLQALAWGSIVRTCVLSRAIASYWQTNKQYMYWIWHLRDTVKIQCILVCIVNATQLKKCEIYQKHFAHFFVFLSIIINLFHSYTCSIRIWSLNNSNL